MLSHRIATRWRELPEIMAGNIIISFSLMATSTHLHLSESGGKPQAFSFWESEREDGRKERP